MSLRQRNRQPELMDAPDLDERDHQHALAGLDRINRLSGTSGRLWRLMRTDATLQPGGELRILDVGCGASDIGIDIARRAKREGTTIVLGGRDISPTAIGLATRRARSAGICCDFQVSDVTQSPLSGEWDIVYSSLFLHHLDERDSISVLTNMRNIARRRVIVEDLIRSRIGYGLCRLGVRLLSRSPIVHVDGPRSVEGAFRLNEVRALAQQAQMVDARLRRRWPERWLLDWVRR